MQHMIPPHLRLVATLITLDVVLFGVFRGIFYQWFHVPDPTITGPMLLNAFYLGLKFDLKLAILINLPIFVLGWIRPFNIRQSVVSKNFWLFYLLLAHGAVIFIYFVDFGHYDYLRQRVDVTVIRFLEDMAISAQMVGESYPLTLILTGYAFLLLLIGWVLNKLLQLARLYPTTDYTGWKKYTVAATAAFLLLGGVYGKLSYYPLRWSDAFFSTNNFISALSSNPILYFYETLKNKESGFDLEETKRLYPVIAQYLGLPGDSQGSDRQVLNQTAEFNFTRVETSHAALNAERPNVVLVFLESFGFYKTGLSGNPMDPTPHFDAMANDGILFDRFYVPHGGTARSVFTLITGIPDVESVKTSTRNPMVVNQQTIINSFVDYEKFYFLGGSASWGNIRGLLSGNIPDLKLFEEGDFQSPRDDVWGINDLNLFEEANAVLREAKKPFFAIIQTAGNHRPYTIPEDNRGFEVRDVTAAEVAPYGFRSVADYNSFRFMDHSLGVFLQQLKKEDYAQNTIFVFFGDHGNDREAKHMFPGEEQLMLTEYHVPLVFYAPGLIDRGKVISTVASEVDVLPTTASLAGIGYTNTTFGRDLFNMQFDDQRYAFTFVRSRPPVLGLIGDEFYFMMRDGGTDRRLYRIHSPTPKENLTESFPELSDELATLAQAFYESIRYVRHHNRPGKEDGRRPMAGESANNSKIGARLPEAHDQ